MSTKLKLIYFNTKDLAETSRILLKIAGVDFEDYRYPLEIINADEHIYKKTEFDTDKKAGLFDKSMGKLPILEIKEQYKTVTISQSKAIERFLAKKCNYMGKTDTDEARIDAICESIRDIKDGFKNLSHYQKLRTDEEKDNYFTLQLKKELVDLTKLMDHDESPYVIGSRLSLADISIYCLITITFNIHRDIVYNIAGRIPKIRDCIIKIANIPEVREWTKQYPI
jgi:glutathione S-transferase